MNTKIKGHDFEEDRVTMMWSCPCSMQINLNMVRAATRGQENSYRALMDSLPACPLSEPDKAV